MPCCITYLCSDCWGKGAMMFSSPPHLPAMLSESSFIASKSFMPNRPILWAQGHEPNSLVVSELEISGLIWGCHPGSFAVYRAKTECPSVPCICVHTLMHLSFHPFLCLLFFHLVLLCILFAMCCPVVSIAHACWVKVPWGVCLALKN